jgi:hypothetical protein
MPSDRKWEMKKNEISLIMQQLLLIEKFELNAQSSYQKKEFIKHLKKPTAKFCGVCHCPVRTHHRIVRIIPQLEALVTASSSRF